MFLLASETRIHAKAAGAGTGRNMTRCQNCRASKSKWCVVRSGLWLGWLGEGETGRQGRGRRCVVGRREDEKRAPRCRLSTRLTRRLTGMAPYIHARTLCTHTHTCKHTQQLRLLPLLDVSALATPAPPPVGSPPLGLLVVNALENDFWWLNRSIGGAGCCCCSCFCCRGPTDATSRHHNTSGWRRISSNPPPHIQQEPTTAAKDKTYG